MVKCFGYLRISDLKQKEGASINAQKAEIERYCKPKAIEIVDWIIETQTAAKVGRPKFNKAVKDVNKGVVDGIVFHKIDRAARNLRDWVAVEDLIDADKAIHFAADGIDVTTRAGRLMAKIIVAFAIDYITNLKGEVKKGQDERLADGLYPFAARAGYLNNGTENKGKPHRLCPMKSVLVRQCLELYHSGQYPMRKLQKEMKRRGLTNRAGKPFSVSGIENIIKDPFYCGIIKIKKTGETYQGKHKPIISVAMFERNQAIREGRCVTGKSKHDYLFRRLFKCALCGNGMIAEKQKGHVYYRCHTKGCAAKCLREDQISESVSAFYDTHKIDQSIIKQIDIWHKKFSQERRNLDESSTLAMQLANLNQKLSQLEDAAIERIIDKKTYEKRRHALITSITKLEEKIELSQGAGNESEKINSFLEPMKNLAQLHEILEPSEKRQLLEIATSNRLAQSKKPLLEPSSLLSKTEEIASVFNCVPQSGRNRTSKSVRDQHMKRLIELANSEEAKELLRLADRTKFSF